MTVLMRLLTDTYSTCVQGHLTNHNMVHATKHLIGRNDCTNVKYDQIMCGRLVLELELKVRVRVRVKG